MVPELDQIYRLTYDGSVADEDNFAVMGGSAEAIADVLGKGFERGLGLAAATKLAVRRWAPTAATANRERWAWTRWKWRSWTGRAAPEVPPHRGPPRRAADRGHRALRSGSRQPRHAATGTGCHETELPPTSGARESS